MQTETQATFDFADAAHTLPRVHEEWIRPCHERRRVLHIILPTRTRAGRVIFRTRLGVFGVSPDEWGAWVAGGARKR